MGTSVKNRIPSITGAIKTYPCQCFPIYLPKRAMRVGCPDAAPAASPLRFFINSALLTNKRIDFQFARVYRAADALARIRKDAVQHVDDRGVVTGHIDGAERIVVVGDDVRRSLIDERVARVVVQSLDRISPGSVFRFRDALQRRNDQPGLREHLLPVRAHHVLDELPCECLVLGVLADAIARRARSAAGNGARDVRLDGRERHYREVVSQCSGIGYARGAHLPAHRHSAAREVALFGLAELRVAVFDEILHLGQPLLEIVIQNGRTVFPDECAAERRGNAVHLDSPVEFRLHYILRVGLIVAAAVIQCPAGLFVILPGPVVFGKRDAVLVEDLFIEINYDLGVIARQKILRSAVLILPQPDEGIVVQRFVKPGLLDEGIEIQEQIFVRKQRDVGIRRPHYVVHETGCHVAHSVQYPAKTQYQSSRKKRCCHLFR